MESTLVSHPIKETNSNINSSQIPVCENCDTPAVGKFCVNCGQEHHPSKVHFKDFVLDYLQSLINIDSRSFKSLRLLVFRPGKLDAQYIQGKRASFIKPSELYLFMSVVFFFVVAHFDPLTLENSADMINKSDLEAIYATKKINTEQLETLFESKVQDKLPTFLLAVVPILALFLGLLYNSKKYFFIHHLTFSYHFFAFLFLLFIPGNFDEDIAAFVVFALFGYLVIALKKAYEQNYIITTIKAAAVWLAVILLLYAYLYISVNYSIAEIKTELGI